MESVLAIILLSITTLGTVIVAYINYRTSTKVAEIQADQKAVKDTTEKVEDKMTKLDIKVDGRLTELLEINKENSRRIGIEEEQEKSKEGNAIQQQMNIDSAEALGKLKGKQEEKDKQQAKDNPPL